MIYDDDDDDEDDDDGDELSVNVFVSFGYNMAL